MKRYIKPVAPDENIGKKVDDQTFIKKIKGRDKVSSKVSQHIIYHVNGSNIPETRRDAGRSYMDMVTSQNDESLEENEVLKAGPDEKNMDESVEGEIGDYECPSFVLSYFAEGIVVVWNNNHVLVKLCRKKPQYIHLRVKYPHGK